MKKIKLSISDEFGNIDFDGSPLWKNSSRYSWLDVEVELGFDDSLYLRLKEWQWKSIIADKNVWEKEEKVKCEIEGLSILLELRKELPNYQITYCSILTDSYLVLNQEQIDDSY